MSPDAVPFTSGFQSARVNARSVTRWTDQFSKKLPGVPTVPPSPDAERGARVASVARTCLVGPRFCAPDQRPLARFFVASAPSRAQIDCMSGLRRPFLYDRYMIVTVDLRRSRRKLEERDFGRLAIALARMRQKQRFALTAWVFLPDPPRRGTSSFIRPIRSGSRER